MNDHERLLWLACGFIVMGWISLIVLVIFAVAQGGL